MMADFLTRKPNVRKQKGLVILIGSLFIGFVLARFTMVSPLAGIIALACGIIIAATVFYRRVDYFIFSWFVLTSLMWLLLPRLPSSYHAYIGRGIFWGILACMIVAWSLDNVLNDRTFTPFENMPVKAITFMFLVLATISLLASEQVVGSVKKLSHIVIGLITAYMFYDFFSRDQRNMEKTLTFLSFILVGTSFITLVISGHALMTGIPIYKKIRLWFFNANSLGYFLFVTSPVLFGVGFGLKNRGIQVLVGFIVLLALFLSFSRASWLAAFVSYVLLIWGRRVGLSITAMMVAGFFTAAVLFPPYGADFIEFILEGRLTYRKELWQAAWDTACDSPLLGTGLGTSAAVIAEHVRTSWLVGQDTHSVYLKNAVDMGFLSAPLLLAFYVAFIVSSAMIQKNLKSAYLKSVTRGAIATVVGLFVHGFFENGFLLTAFDAAEFTVIWPYVLLSFPFACQRLDKRAESG
jgi:O-antigen ligase